MSIMSDSVNWGSAEAASGTPPAPQLPNPRLSTLSGQRFRILKLHSHGGLGDVFLARDEELHREVALKRIHKRFADHAAIRARFVREAEITGALEHPGIVPVYGLGQSADGRPFYAMRFIRGETLAQAIDHYHHHDSSPAARQRELRQLISRLVAVCNTMAYAHSQDVLHRDLKPDNILLERYGETLVMDWGLARGPQAKDESPPPRPTTNGQAIPEYPSSQRTFELDHPSVLAHDAVLTQSHRTLGTPEYMSPEQAAGRLHELTPASDIYSLGATLYHLLVGQRPFAEVDREWILHQVQQGELARPRQKTSHVPPALEAICLKAMAHKPEQRYSTAVELADELERWLADDVVLTYAEPWVDRVGRWARRHKGWVGLATVTMLFAAMTSLTNEMLLAARRQQTLEQDRADRMQRWATQEAQLRQITESERQQAERLRVEAELNKQKSERYLYFSRINMAEHAWEEARIPRARELLTELRHDHPASLGFEWRYLWRLQASSLHVLQGADDSVRTVAFSPDGRYVVSAGFEPKVRIWNSRTGKLEHVLDTHTVGLNSVAYSPDGKFLATAARDGNLSIWDVAAPGAGISPAPRITFAAHRQEVFSVAFSPDGRRLASGGGDHMIYLWDLTKLTNPGPNRPALSLSGHRDRVTSVCFSPDGRRLASTSAASAETGVRAEIKLWDACSGHETATLLGHTHSVRCVSFSPDGRLLASASLDHSVRVWEVAPPPHNPRAGVPLTLRGHTDSVLALAFSPDGKRLASGSEDRMIKIWNLENGQELFSYRGHTQQVNTLAYRCDGRILASGADDGTLRLWDATTSQEARTLTGHGNDVNQVSYSPDGGYLASASNDATIRLWDSATGEEMRVLPGVAAVNGLVFRRDRACLASAHDDGTLKLWEVPSGHLLHTWKPSNQPASHVVFADAYLVSATADGRIYVWDTGFGENASATPLRAWQGHAGLIHHLAVSPNGRRLASAGEDGTAKVWDLGTGQLIYDVTQHRAPVYAVAFSPDGQWLATASVDTTARLWDAATGTPKGPVLKGHGHMVMSVAFSPDSRRLASGGNDHAIKLWDVTTGEEALTLKGHTDSVTSLAFRADGTALASSSDDGTVKIWSAALGAEPAAAGP
jgi:WD40 repeat protein/serine/threonine protein kinase